MEKLFQVLEKYQWPARTEEPATSFEEVEAFIKFKLPEDYKIFVSNFLGFYGFIGPHYVHFWHFDELIELNTGYQFIEYLPQTLGIGSDGGGECIAIELTDQNQYRIVLTPYSWDVEDQIEIGTSFTDFLIRMDNGQEWFT